MTKITKSEKILREGLNKWKNFLNEGAFKKVNENNPPKAADGYHIHPGRTPVRVVGGSLKGAEGKAIEITTSTTGETAIVVELTKDAERKVFGKAGDEVIVLPGDVETIGTDMGDDPKMDYYNDMPSRDGELREGGTMGEYGKMDAEQGLPPTKIGRGNEEYMAAYNAVLQARGEEPMDIQQPDQAYLDALRSGRLEEGDAEFKVGDEVIANGRPGTITDLSIPGMATVDLGRQGETTVSLSDIRHNDMNEKLSAADKEFHKSVMDKGKVANLKGDMGPIPGLEGPFQYRSGAVLYYDPQNGQYYDRGKDMYLDREEAAELTMENVEGSDGLENARQLIAFARKRIDDDLDFEYELKANSRIDWEDIVKSLSRAERLVLEHQDEMKGLKEGAGHDESILQAQNQGVAFVRGQDDRAAGKEKDPNYSEESGRNPLEVLFYNAGYSSELAENFSSKSESNEPFDMKAHMAAYENEPETIEYRKQVNRLIQMVADKKGIPVEQAAEEIASYVITAQGMKEAIGMQNIEKRRKPAAAPAGQKLSPTKMAMNFMAEKGYDASKINVMDLIDHLRSARAKTQEEVNTAVIDFIQKNNISMTEGAGDKEARIRDIVKMGSWDNIDGVSVSLPQAELLVAAMDKLNPANKEKLMAMPIDKMLDIVNKMVDRGVITVDYGHAGLREMMPDRTTYSSDPEMDQIEDIARTKLEKGGYLGDVASALQDEGFDATLSSGAISIDGKYFMGKADNFDISPDEEVRKVGKFVLGYMG